MHVPYISTSVGTSKQPRLAAQECGKGSLYQYFKGCSLAFKRPGSGTEWSLGVILPVNIFFWIFSFSERAPENSGAKFRYFWRHILAPKFKTIHCFGVSKTLMIDMHATLFEFKSWCRLYFCCYYWVSAVAQHSTVFESCWFWRTENIAFWHKIIHFCRNSNLQKAAANVFQQRRFRISRVSSDRGTVAVVQAELFHSMLPSISISVGHFDRRWATFILCCLASPTLPWRQQLSTAQADGPPSVEMSQAAIIGHFYKATLALKRLDLCSEHSLDKYMHPWFLWTFYHYK